MTRLQLGAQCQFLQAVEVCPHQCIPLLAGIQQNTYCGEQFTQALYILRLGILNLQSYNVALVQIHEALGQETTTTCQRAKTTMDTDAERDWAARC